MPAFAKKWSGLAKSLEIVSGFEVLNTSLEAKSKQPNDLRRRVQLTSICDSVDQAKLAIELARTEGREEDARDLAESLLSWLGSRVSPEETRLRTELERRVRLLRDERAKLRAEAALTAGKLSALEDAPAQIQTLKDIRQQQKSELDVARQQCQDLVGQLADLQSASDRASENLRRHQEASRQECEDHRQVVQEQDDDLAKAKKQLDEIQRSYHSLSNRLQEATHERDQLIKSH